MPHSIWNNVDRVQNATGGMYMSDKDINNDAEGYQGVGLGHMSDVPVAAFDPIFWLHHWRVKTTEVQVRHD